MATILPNSIAVRVHALDHGALEIDAAFLARAIVRLDPPALLIEPHDAERVVKRGDRRSRQ